MNLLDQYLQNHNLKRYDVFKQTGLSQQMLASVNKKKISSYSVRVIKAIAETVGKGQGEVLEELILLEQESPYFIANNHEELLQAFKNKELYILIKGDYKKQIDEISKGMLNDTETMGVGLGSAGTMSILGEVFYKIGSLFTEEDSELRKVKDQIRFYKIKRLSDDELLLYLRQLDY